MKTEPVMKLLKMFNALDNHPILHQWLAHISFYIDGNISYCSVGNDWFGFTTSVSAVPML